MARGCVTIQSTYCDLVALGVQSVKSIAIHYSVLQQAVLA